MGASPAQNCSQLTVGTVCAIDGANSKAGDQVMWWWGGLCLLVLLCAAVWWSLKAFEESEARECEHLGEGWHDLF